MYEEIRARQASSSCVGKWDRWKGSQISQGLWGLDDRKFSLEFEIQEVLRDRCRPGEGDSCGYYSPAVSSERTGSHRRSLIDGVSMRLCYRTPSFLVCCSIVNLLVKHMSRYSCYLQNLWWGSLVRIWLSDIWIQSSKLPSSDTTLTHSHQSSIKGDLGHQGMLGEEVKAMVGLTNRLVNFDEASSTLSWALRGFGSKRPWGSHSSTLVPRSWFAIDFCITSLPQWPLKSRPQI